MNLQLVIFLIFTICFCNLNAESNKPDILDSYYDYFNQYTYTGPICTGDLVVVSSIETGKCLYDVFNDEYYSYSCNSNGTYVHYYYSTANCSTVTSSESFTADSCTSQYADISILTSCVNTLPSEYPDGDGFTIENYATSLNCNSNDLYQAVTFLANYCYDTSISSDVLTSEEFQLTSNSVVRYGYIGSPSCSSDSLVSTFSLSTNVCSNYEGNFIIISAPTNSNNNNTSSNTNLIVGLVVGLIGGLLLVTALYFLYFRKNKQVVSSVFVSSTDIKTQLVNSQF